MRAPCLVLLALAGLACGSSSDDAPAVSGSAGSSNGKGGGSGGKAGASGGSPAGGAGGFATSGSGGASGGSGPAGGSGGNGFCGTKLTGTLRDFTTSHPDFETFLGDDKGIVKGDLGSDGKPVYASSTDTKTTTGKAAFDQWFHDTQGVNQPFPLEIQLTKSGTNVYTFDDGAFFPLDGKGFGNEGNPHNYHFTFELHTTFQYAGGETFVFTGDDDLFTFIAGKLVIDLGGVHGAEMAEVKLDEVAGQLGLQKGKTYPLDFFFAERHTVDSHFRIDTTLVFTDCGSFEPPK